MHGMYYYRRPFAIKNQRGASKRPYSGLRMPELVLYGTRLLAPATPRNSPRHEGGQLCLQESLHQGWLRGGGRVRLQRLHCGGGESLQRYHRSQGGGTSHQNVGLEFSETLITFLFVIILMK